MLLRRRWRLPRQRRWQLDERAGTWSAALQGGSWTTTGAPGPAGCQENRSFLALERGSRTRSGAVEARQFKRSSTRTLYSLPFTCLASRFVATVLRWVARWASTSSFPLAPSRSAWAIATSRSCTSGGATTHLPAAGARPRRPARLWYWPEVQAWARFSGRLDALGHPRPSRRGVGLTGRRSAE